MQIELTRDQDDAEALIRQKIQNEQVRLLYAHTIRGLVITAVTATGLCAVLWDVIETRVLGLWLMWVLIIVVARYILAVTYFHSSAPEKNPGIWGVGFGIGAVLTGVVWGVGSIVLFPAESVPHQLFVVSVLVGMMAAATSYLSSIPWIYIAYLLTGMGPFGTLQFTQNLPYPYLGIAVVLFIFVLLINSRSLYNTIMNSLWFRYKNEVMAQELAEAIEVAEAANLVKTQFMSNISHELRTPLTSIRGSLGLLAAGVTAESPEKTIELLDIAKKNTERLFGLVNDLLDIDKISAGGFTLEIKKFALMPFIEEAVAVNSGYAQQFNVQFRIMNRLDDITMHGDRDRLMQVMNNLLSNAAKFTNENDIIEVGLTIHHDRVRVSILDHGPGIPEEASQRVFDRFVQLDSSMTRKRGGSGLGLNIAREIVEQHGGEIRIDGMVTTGTRIFFDIPADLDAPGPNLVTD
jgi:signal transduction histidine kinase